MWIGFYIFDSHFTTRELILENWFTRNTQEGLRNCSGGIGKTYSQDIGE